MPEDAAPRSLLPLVLAVVGVAALVAGGSLALVAGTLADRTDASASARSPVHAVGAAEAEGYEPWAVNDDGRPVRWSPCETLELVVAPAGLPPTFAATLEDAVEEIAAAADLRLTVGDEVEEAAAGDRAVYQPERYGERWAPVLVAGAEPGERGLPLRETDRAIAVPVAVGPPGQQVFVSGQVVINTERDDLGPGAEDPEAPSLSTVLRHELGHLLGLDHVDDREQLMYAYPGPGETPLGDGDLRGLDALGAGGCSEVPEPTPVEVDAALER